MCRIQRSIRDRLGTVFFQFQLSNHLPVAEPNKQPRLQQIMAKLHTEGHNIHPRAIKCVCRNF